MLTDSCIVSAGCVAVQRVPAHGCVGVAGGEVEERTIALSRIEVGITAIRRRQRELSMADLTQGGIVPFRAGTRQDFL